MTPTAPLNPGTFLSSLAFRAGLDAARFGSGSTSILYFTGAPTTGGMGITQATTAALGSEFTVELPGMYHVRVSGTNAGAAPAVAGVSINTDAAGLTAAVTLAVVGMEAIATTAGQDAAGNAAPLELSEVIAVTAADIQAGRDAGADGAVIRAHGSGAGLVVAACTFAMKRISSLF